MTTETTARIQEYNGTVAVCIGEGEILYLSTNLAKRLSKELALASNQIAGGYHYPITEIVGNG